MMTPFPLPVLGFAAYSGTGKTTLLTQLIPLLRQRGIRIAVVKHAHHEFDVDKPGKDSYELRKAGAIQTLVASRRRWALITESEGDREPDLGDLIDQLQHDDLDLVLVEGFKKVPFPKIELHRSEVGMPFLFPEDPSIIAIACDQSVLPQTTDLPVLDINQPQGIAAFVQERFLNEPQIKKLKP